MQRGAGEARSREGTAVRLGPAAAATADGGASEWPKRTTGSQSFRLASEQAAMVSEFGDGLRGECDVRWVDLIHIHMHPVAEAAEPPRRSRRAAGRLVDSERIEVSKRAMSIQKTSHTCAAATAATQRHTFRSSACAMSPCHGAHTVYGPYKRMGVR